MNVRIALCAVWVILSSNTQVQSGDPTISVATDKGTYEFAEEIRLTVKVTNQGRISHTLLALPFETPAKSLLRITAPPGQRLSTRMEYGKGVLLESLKAIITVDPGASHVVTYDLMQHYPDSYTSGAPHNFDLPGTYELVVRYALEEYMQALVPAVYAGPIESAPIRFVVKPLKGIRLQELLKQFHDEDPVGKANTVGLLRRGGAIEHIPDLMGLLASGQPEPMRLQAALAVYEAPNPNAWQKYAELLEDSNPRIRGMMAATLGEIGQKGAGDALYKLTDPAKYPENYLAAFKALVQIGDPRVREVASALKDTAPSADVRDIAQKLLEGRPPDHSWTANTKDPRD